MKYAIIGLLVTAATSFTSPARDGEMDLHVQRALHNPQSVLNLRLSDQERAALVAKIHDARANAPPVNKLRADGALINLGDQGAAQRVIAETKDSSPRARAMAFNTLYRCPQPWLLVLIEPIVMLNDPAPGHWAAEPETLAEPRSSQAVRTVLKILRSSDSVGEEARLWAASLQGWPIADKRAALREWYTANQAMLKAGKYGELTGLEEDEARQ